MKNEKTNANTSLVDEKAPLNGISNFMEIVETAMLNGGVKTVAPCLEKIAEKGDAQAAFFLAECYLKGDVFSCDDDKAAKYLVQASKLGNTDAHVRLGAIGYFNAKSADEFIEVFDDFHQAALAGHPEAEFIISMFYEKGYGCKQNKTLAQLWRLKAHLDHFDRKVVCDLLGLSN